MENQESSKYSIELCSTFDEIFFNEFINIRTISYRDNPSFLPESLDEFEKLYSNDSPFSEFLEWEAVIIREDSKSIARILYTTHKTANNDIVNCGYIESPNDIEMFNKLLEQAKNFAKKHGKQTLKGPIQGTFFNAYRCKIKGDYPSYYSEPLHHDYLPELFLKSGFIENGRWDTTRLNIVKTWENFKQIRKTIPKKNKAPSKLKIRGISFFKWDRDLEIVYNLFMKSFSYMPEFEPISFDCFKLLYSDFKYLINPLATYIIEHEGTPVAFNINFFDPLPIIQKAKKLEEKFNSSIWKKLIKLYTLIRLKLNLKKLLIMYVGKVPLENGEEVKGVQALVSRRIFIMWKFFGVKEMLVCYSSTNSPSRKSFKNQNHDFCASYAVFTKNID